MMKKFAFPSLLIATVPFFFGCMSVFRTSHPSDALYTTYDPNTRLSYTTSYALNGVFSNTHPPMAIVSSRRCEFDDLLFLQHRINELDLKWTYIKIWEDGTVGLEVFEPLPWNLKRFNEKSKLASDLIAEMEERRDSNQKLEPTVKTPVE